MNKQTTDKLVSDISFNIGALVSETNDPEAIKLLNEILIATLKVSDILSKGGRS